MGLLKNKLAKAQKAQELKEATFLDNVEIIIKKEEPDASFLEEDNASNNNDLSTTDRSQLQRTDSSETFITPLKVRASKSIVKNYGKAICSFACSNLAVPYLEPLIRDAKINYDDFIRYMTNAKNSIDSLQAFQSVLLITERDDVQMAALKKVFGSIGEVFIKYFSVNWIYSGKIVHKDAHLKARFKILRRIQNPQFFTYLK